MAAVIREVARIRRLVLAVDFSIGVELGLELRRRRKTDRAKFLFFGFVVKHDCRRRTGLRLRARAVGRLALGQHTATAESRRIERIRIAAHLLPSLLHLRECCNRRLRSAHRGDPVGAELRGQHAPTRSERGNVHGDRIMQIDELKFRVEEADLVGTSFR